MTWMSRHADRCIAVAFLEASIAKRKITKYLKPHLHPNWESSMFIGVSEKSWELSVLVVKNGFPSNCQRNSNAPNVIVLIGFREKVSTSFLNLVLVFSISCVMILKMVEISFLIVLWMQKMQGFLAAYLTTVTFQYPLLADLVYAERVTHLDWGKFKRRHGWKTDKEFEPVQQEHTPIVFYFRAKARTFLHDVLSWKINTGTSSNGSFLEVMIFSFSHSREHNAGRSSWYSEGERDRKAHFIFTFSASSVPSFCLCTVLSRLQDPDFA